MIEISTEQNNNTDKDLDCTINELVRNFKYEKAEEILTSLINNNPKNLYYRAKRIEVITALNNDNTHYSNGSVIIYDNMPQKEVHYNLLYEDYTFLLQTYQTEELYKKRGDFLYELFKYEYAILDYEQALKFNPKSARYHYKIAKAYTYLNNNLKAIEHYTYAIENFYAATFNEIDSIDELYYDRYCTYMKIGELEKAYNDIIMAYNRNPSYSYIEPSLKLCYKLKKYDTALQIIQKHSYYEYYIIPYIYRKLGLKALEKQYYKNIIQKKDFWTYNLKQHTYLYKKLRTLYGRKPLPMLSLQYLLDKYIFYPKHIIKDFFTPSDIIY